MKRLLLLFSICFVLLGFISGLYNVEATSEEYNDCDNGYNSVVNIVNNYNVFVSSGIVVSVDDKYSYIATSSINISDNHNYGVNYNDGSFESAIVLGIDKYNEIAVFRTEKNESIKGVCFANSNYLDKGEINYLKGYLDKDVEFYSQTYVGAVGSLFYNSNNIRIYKNVVSYRNHINLQGVAVFDSNGKLTGIVSGNSSESIGEMYVVESNRVLKIVDSIKKTGNYYVNYIKYNIVDLTELSIELRDSYGVNENVKKGVVITTFKPLKYIFGGLNQGMVIIGVNGVDVDNCYELDKQLIRYKKNSRVSLRVIKSNGKQANYLVKI